MTVLWGRKREYGRPRVTWDANIEADYKEVGYECLDRTDLV